MSAGHPPGQVSPSTVARRRFLKWATALGGLASALLVGVPTLRAFLWPAFKPPTQPAWLRLGDIGRFDVEVPTKLDFAATVRDAWVEQRTLRSVWVYTEDGERFTVYNAHCTHLGCMVGFDAEEGVMRCPCHNGVFDPATGKVLAGPPPRALDVLESKVEDDVLYALYRDYRVGVPQKIAV